MNPASKVEDGALAAMLEGAVNELALDEPEPLRQPDTVAVLRRRRGTPPESLRDRVSLVRVDGVLRWIYQRAPARIGGRRARRASESIIGADRLTSFGFQAVPPNEVVQRLEELDRKLTPNQGLRRWDGQALSSADGIRSSKRALLFVHGTFSKSDMFFQEIAASRDGAEFLRKALKQYEHVLAFNHPTLSVSPILNALDLERSLAGYTGPIDLVCHSRGGLVASWWLRTGQRNVGKVLYVGSPLEGTSLAAPARLKDALDGLANLADTLKHLATVAGSFVPPAQPFLGVAAGLMKIVGGVLSVGAKTPLLDAGIAIVPGLAAQSRVSNNQELLRLHREAWPSSPQCFAMKSNFEPADPEAPWWQFWKRLRRPLASVAAAGADHIFEGPNDLVVDTSSMTQLIGSAFPAARVLDFGTNDRVHHTNYFAQPESARFLAKVLS